MSNRNASIKDDYDICNTLKKLILDYFIYLDGQNSDVACLSSITLLDSVLEFQGDVFSRRKPRVWEKFMIEET